MKILVAENDSITRALICVPLRTVAELEVIEAADGQWARALFDKNLFVAVVIDWRMPGLNGLDFTRSVRLVGSHAPILMISAYKDRWQVLRAIKAGISDYLLIPFEADALWSKLTRLIGRPVHTQQPADSPATSGLEIEGRTLAHLQVKAG